MVNDIIPQMNSQITIVVPIFNEEECLPLFFKKMDSFLSHTETPITVLLVDDGSKDHSAKIIAKKCSQDPKYTCITLEKNSGLSAALKAGITASKTLYTGYIDADLQTDPEDFQTFYPLLWQYDLVCGIRQKRKDSIVKKISSKVANYIRRWVLNDGIQDSGCPLKIGKTTVLQQLPAFKGFHRFLPALVMMSGGSVIQLPVRHFQRAAGTAKYNLFNRLIGPFVDMLGVSWLRSRAIHIKTIS